jgi:uncharacterized protein YdaU (DUF1376 family)
VTKKPDDWMPLHIGKYLADTTHLTRDQHGAYLLLLMAYWRRGGPLVADDARLAATAKATPAEWRKLKPVLAEFFTAEDGRWVQKRAQEELIKANSLTQAKADAGRKGAQKRWHRDGTTDGKRMAEPSPSDRQTDAPIPLPEQEAAAVAQTNSDDLNRLNRILGFDPGNFTAHAANIRTLIDLKAQGCDFSRHILPAAEAAARGGRTVGALAYVRPKALELRDAERTVFAQPVPFENTDERGWRDRVRVFGEMGGWSPKWGPKPGEPGCKCPETIQREAA